MSTPGELSGIRGLRALVRLLAALPDGGGEAGQWFIAGVAAYQAGAPKVTLDECCGLKPQQGQPSWATIERQQAHAVKIAEIFGFVFSGAPPPSLDAAAAQIANVLQLYETSAWRRQRDQPKAPPDPLHRLLWQALRLDAAKSISTIRRRLLEAGASS